MWLDDVTSTRALLNISRMPDKEAVTTETDGSKEPDLASEENKGEADYGTGRATFTTWCLSLICTLFCLSSKKSGLK